MHRPIHLALLALALIGSGCGRQPDLVVYCSLDQEFAEPLVQRFAKESGLEVRAEFDVEAAKTVGLVARLREEAQNPRCDVFWNNEVAHTAALATDGLLEAYDSPSAAEIPAQFRDPGKRWTGFAARARILIVNTKACDPHSITSMWDLVDAKWSGKAGMAKPLTGTTMSHTAALYLVLGAEKADEYLTRIQAASQSGAINLTNGNASVARLVGDGELAFGWTDTDDFAVAKERGAPVAAVYPDAQGCGTLLLPTAVAIVKGAPHDQNARRFVDWVLRPEIERELAFSRSAQIPVRDSVERPPDMVTPGKFKVMQLDYSALGAELERRADHLKKLFVQ